MNIIKKIPTIKNKYKVLVFVLYWIVLVELILQSISLGRYVYYLKKYHQNDTWFFRDQNNQKIISDYKNLYPEYHPFLGWRINSKSSSYFNFDDKGFRITPKNTSTNSVGDMYLFGGSSLYGAYVQDNETIPAYLSKAMGTYTVFNFGVIAYNSNQEVINLLLQLKEGKNPAYVIFYDGCNDIGAYPYTVYQQDRLKEEFKETWDFLWRGPENNSVFNYDILKQIPKYIKLIQYPLAIINNFHPKINTAIEYGKQDDEVEYITNNYVKNAQTIDHLSHEYNFKYLLLWQPLVYSKKLTDNEKGINMTVGNRNNDAIYKKVTEKLNQENISNFYDLSNVFDDYTNDSLYIDACHVTKEGNRIVADRIEKILQDIQN
jgi:lysophospholipase L1-like esterase